MGAGCAVLVFIQVPHNSTYKALPRFGLVIRIEIGGAKEEFAEYVVYGLVVWDVGGAAKIVVLEGGMVFDPEAEVDGFVLGGPAVEHDVLVVAWAFLEVAEGGRVPGLLHLGAWEEGRLGWGGGVHQGLPLTSRSIALVSACRRSLA